MAEDKILFSSWNIIILKDFFFRTGPPSLVFSNWHLSASLSLSVGLLLRLFSWSFCASWSHKTASSKAGNEQWRRPSIKPIMKECTGSSTTLSKVREREWQLSVDRRKDTKWPWPSRRPTTSKDPARSRSPATATPLTEIWCRNQEGLQLPWTGPNQGPRLGPQAFAGRTRPLCQGRTSSPTLATPKSKGTWCYDFLLQIFLFLASEEVCQK